MTKARDLADFVSAGNPLADGTIDVADINGVTATVDEINILDGVTATTAELNYTDGVTSNLQTQLDAKAPTASPTFTGTATYATLSDGTTTLTSTVAELNILDGVTATTAELNILDGVTATTAELNYVDGVTSNIQTQLNTKFATTGGTLTGAAQGSTDTDTTNTGNVTLDFSTNQNFVLTLTGNVTLDNPTTETVGQSGFIVFIQDATGGRTVSLGTDYETAGGAGLTLSSTANTTDVVPYIVVASGRILLGAPQLAFA